MIACVAVSAEEARQSRDDAANNPISKTVGAAAEIVQSFLSTLGSHEKNAVVRPFDSPERKRWRRDPGPRPGLACMDMTDEQRKLIDQLVQTVLSDVGFSLVQGVRKEQNLLGAHEEGLGEGYYWFAVYGIPGKGYWSWRFGGHHVSLHVSYSADEVISVTPAMFGGEMLGKPEQGWLGFERLRDREMIASRLAASCDADQWTTMRFDTKDPAVLVLSEPENLPIDSPDRGLAWSSLTTSQRMTSEELVESYLRVFRPEFADKLRSKFRSAADHARIAWSGERSEGAAHYYRIHAPGFLMEYSNSGAHIHTLLRTSEDFGATPAAP